jgi:DNA uptake protein ComE-like DNA-binding protein
MKRHSTHHRRRTASVLILTLVVVAMLTLGAMAFFERMFAEHRATVATGRRLQARHLAESGIEHIKVVLAQDPELIRQSGGLYANPSLFQNILVVDDPLAAFRGRMTILAPEMTTDGYFGGVRCGLENESSRLNLNTLLLADQLEQDGARNVLMTLPGMTEPIADAILDWIDTDDDPRIVGAEREYYSTLSPAYEPRNGPLGSIEELLLVRDVTPALLFGADLNRNGIVDPNEEPFRAIDNADNTTGELDRGWAAYLTLDSAETNLKADGTPKIDVNMDDLKELNTQLTAVLDANMANFIIAYRQGGAYEGTENERGQEASSLTLDFTQQGRVKLNTILDLVGVKTRIAKPNQAGQTGQPGGSGQGGQQGGGGGGSGGQSGKGQDSRIVVNPAFANDRSAMRTYLPILMENLAVNAAPSIPGRLNINQAPRRLLTGVPGLDENAVDQIIANREIEPGVQRPEQAYETWLLSDGIVELKDMKKLMALVTTGGSVYRAQIVGFFEADGPITRVETVIDATQSPAIVRRRWEMGDLGPGHTLETLGVPVADVP